MRRPICSRYILMLSCLAMVICSCAQENTSEDSDTKAKVVSSDIEFRVNENNDLIIGGEVVTSEEVCLLIRPYFKSGKRILFESEGGTNYQFYLSAYKLIQTCYTARLEEKSLELFNKPVGELSTEEKAHVKEILPFSFIERLPGH